MGEVCWVFVCDLCFGYCMSVFKYVDGFVVFIVVLEVEFVLDLLGCSVLLCYGELIVVLNVISGECVDL